MKTITMLDLRQRGREIIKRLAGGERMALTYRGKRVGMLVPEAGTDQPTPLDSPIRRLSELADPALEPMTNEEIDQFLYGDQDHVP